jgi:hypothetical protein
MHFEYDGTADCCNNVLHESAWGVESNWRNEQSASCACGKDEPCEIATQYGGGMYYATARACRKCKAIAFDPFFACMWNDGPAPQDFLPNWWEP